MEANIDEGGNSADGEDYTLIDVQALLTKDPEQLKRMVAEKKEEMQQHRDDATEAVPMDADKGEAEPNSFITLTGHDSTTFQCAWSPNEELLATGSGDGTVRIWNVESSVDLSEPIILKHNMRAPDGKGIANQGQKDVTTVAWNYDGQLLATGGYDGNARIYSKDGNLKWLLQSHTGPIFIARFNSTGEYLATGSVDKRGIVWDTCQGVLKTTYSHHQGAVLDLDWKNQDTFAIGSTDHTISICKVGQEDPVKVFSGHSMEVNTVRWDPYGRVLASCSVDHTIKLWQMSSDNYTQNLLSHTQEVYTIRWRPPPGGAANANGAGTSSSGAHRNMIASASQDQTCKLWDAETGQCLQTWTSKTQPIYTIDFSPDGKFLAAGSFDNMMYVWSLQDYSVVQELKGEQGIFDLAWNKAGDKVAACHSNKISVICNLRM